MNTYIGVYDGIWVGRNSKIANVDGIRKQFVDDMKRIGAPNYRWPGGCFADGYHWRDGIGAAGKRPRTYNYWQASMPSGLDHTETNEFGIHEFIRLCRLTGAEPYLAANMDRVRRGNSMSGCSTATPRPERCLSPLNARRMAIRSRSASAGGASGTSPGAVAAI